MADSSAGQGYNFTNAPEVFDIGIRSVPQKRHNRAQHSALERKNSLRWSGMLRIHQFAGGVRYWDSFCLAKASQRDATPFLDQETLIAGAAPYDSTNAPEVSNFGIRSVSKTGARDATPVLRQGTLAAGAAQYERNLSHVYT